MGLHRLCPYGPGSVSEPLVSEHCWTQTRDVEVYGQIVSSPVGEEVVMAGGMSCLEH